MKLKWLFLRQQWQFNQNAAFPSSLNGTKINYFTSYSYDEHKKGGKKGEGACKRIECSICFCYFLFVFWFSSQFHLNRFDILTFSHFFCFFFSSFTSVFVKWTNLCTENIFISIGKKGMYNEKRSSIFFILAFEFRFHRNFHSKCLELNPNN